MKFLGWQKQVGQVASPLRATSRVHGIKGQEKPSFVLHRGWMPRQKSCWPPVVGKLFLLTSPFREQPIINMLGSFLPSLGQISTAKYCHFICSLTYFLSSIGKGAAQLA